VRLTLNDQPREVLPLGEAVPAWITADVIDPLEQRAVERLREGLMDERPVRLVVTLNELSEHRQREVRWLAERSLGAIGDFRPLVAGLNDPERKQLWNDYIHELRNAVRLAPEMAAMVRTAMERQFGQEGSSLYEMLWKYDGKSELSKQEAARLVGFLEHDTLAFRVLSFWNLQTITGLSLYYRPEYPAARREQPVQKWRERLEVDSTTPIGEGAAAGVPAGGLLAPRGSGTGGTAPATQE